MPDAAKIIKDWCASCGMAEPSDGECHALAVAISAAAPVVLPESLAKAIDRFDAYFRSANGVPPNARISVPTSEWQELRALLATATAATEPFGYFKAEPFGWTDCGPDDEGAVALYEKPQVLATGGQAQAVQPITGPCGQCKSSIQPCDCAISTILKDRGLVAVDATHYSKVSAQAKAAAPQAQADAREAEQERWMGIGKAIERACVDLPAGAEINIHLEKDAGTVTLSDCDGDEQENFPTDEGLAGVVNAAIDTAIAAAKGEQQ